MTKINITRAVRRLGAPLVAAGLVLSGCSSDNAAGGNPGTVVNTNLGKLQLAVGTANIFGDTPDSAVVGLNVVETFRQSKGEQTTGDSNALVDSPTLSGPFILPTTPGTPDGAGATIETGPGPSDAGGSTMNSTGQPDPGAATVDASTFGVSTNASGQGLEPFNFTAVDTQSNGTPYTYVPYVQPLFDPAYGSDLNSFTPWGGPPAYDPDKDGLGVRDGNPIPSGVDGVSLGLDVFEGVAPATGTYNLAVTVAKNGGGVNTSTASATLGSPALLPAITPATIALDGTGGGTVTVALPAGVTEALVQIEDIGPPQTGATGCNSANFVPVYYTIEASASGTYTLPDAIGPGTPAAPGVTLCTAAQNQAATTAAGGTMVTATGDVFMVQTIGFDYPAYEASYPQSNGNPAPTIVGASGQSDITISSANVCTTDTATGGCASAAAASSGTSVKRAHMLRHFSLKRQFTVVRKAR
jgi:hypothetical protein